jgi:uncharacterized repeat protein (TIGR02543 family)
MKKLISISASLLLAGASLVAVASPAHATSILGNYYLASSNTVGNPQTIVQLDPATLQPLSTPIATFAADNMISGLEVDATNGLAYAVTFGYSLSVPTQFWTIDIATGTATLVNAAVGSAPGVNDRNITDLALDPVTGVLYGRSDDGSSLVTFDKLTGAVTAFDTPVAGSMSSLAAGFGLAIDDQQNRIWTGRSGTSSNLTTFLGAASAQGVVSQIGRSLTGTFSANSSDFAPNGDLILWRLGNPARAGIISAASYAALSKDVSAGPSSTSTQFVTTTLANTFATDSDAFAVANVAPALSRTISYDANHGAGMISATVGSGALTVSAGTNYTRSGYTLSGWNTAANGSGTAVALGASYTPTQNETLYAQWVAVPVVSSPVAYAGPNFSAIQNRYVDSVLGGNLKLTGTQLSGVSKVQVAGKTVKIVSASDSQIELAIPAGTPGSAEMVITFAAGQMTWANAFTYVDPAVVKAAALKRIPAPAKKPAKAKPKSKK